VAIEAENTQAEQVGPGTVTIVAELSAVNAIHRLRAIRGIIRLRKQYGDTRLDAACARALAVGDPRYRTVKGIPAAWHRTRWLVSSTRHEPPASVGLACRPVGAWRQRLVKRLRVGSGCD
jgi:hypothetical protein